MNTIHAMTVLFVCLAADEVQAAGQFGEGARRAHGDASDDHRRALVVREDAATAGLQ